MSFLNNSITQNFFLKIKECISMSFIELSYSKIQCKIYFIYFQMGFKIEDEKIILKNNIFKVI